MKPLNFPRGLAGKLGKNPVHIWKIKHGKTKPSASLSMAIYRELSGEVRLSDILRPDKDFLELCQIIVREQE